MTQLAAESGDFRVIDRVSTGDGEVAGWIAYPDEDLQRASHALVVDGTVWLVDPVDRPGLDAFLADLGEVAGVALLLDRHRRDAAAIATRHDVAVHLPAFFEGVAAELDAPIERFRRQLGSTGYGSHKLVDNRFWQEAALYGEDTGVLLVPESVGTIPFFCAGDERLGVHPARRLTPPRKLARLEPDHVLVGHGTGIHDDAPAALHDAIRGARRRAPRLWAKDLRLLLSR